PPDRYLVRLRCKGFVRGRDDTVHEADDFLAGIWFPSDYLRHVEPLQVVTWLEPAEVFHPNIRPPLVCLGPIAPGTPLVQLIYRLFDLVSYQMWAAHDALNAEAAQWTRNHPEFLPADRRPLKRRPLHPEQEPETVGDLS